MKFSLTLTVALCCYSQQAAIRYKPTVTSRPSSLPPRWSPRRFGSHGVPRNSAPDGLTECRSDVFSFRSGRCKSGGIRSVPASPSSRIAFGDKYGVWSQPTPLNSVLHVFSLQDKTQKTVTVDIRGIIQLALVDEPNVAVAPFPDSTPTACQWLHVVGLAGTASWPQSPPRGQIGSSVAMEMAAGVAKRPRKGWAAGDDFALRR